MIESFTAAVTVICFALCFAASLCAYSVSNDTSGGDMTAGIGIILGICMFLVAVVTGLTGLIGLAVLIFGGPP